MAYPILRKKELYFIKERGQDQTEQGILPIHPEELALNQCYSI